MTGQMLLGELKGHISLLYVCNANFYDTIYRPYSTIFDDLNFTILTEISWLVSICNIFFST